MRPVFHYRPWRIQAHISIAVLALLLERVAEIRTGETWRNLAAGLEKIQVVEYDRGEARIQQTTEVRPEAVELLRKLKVALPPKIHSVAPVPPDVESVAAVELDPLVDDGHRPLPRKAQARERQFMAQAFFIGGLQEPRAEVAVDLDARSEDSLGQIPQSPDPPGTFP